jgi:hypothetical protein
MCPESGGKKFKADKIITNVFNTKNYNGLSLATSPDCNKQQNNTNNWQQVGTTHVSTHHSITGACA